MLDKAYEWITRRGDFAGSLQLLRQIPEPIRAVSDVDARRLFEKLVVLAATGYKVPERERIRLELILAETELRWDANAGGLRFIDTYGAASQIADPEVRLGCLSATYSTLLKIDASDETFGLRAELRTAIRQAGSTLMSCSADHHALTQRALKTLASIDLDLAIEIVGAINTQERRNRALADVATSAAQSGRIDLGRLVQILMQIDDTDRIVGPALHRSLQSQSALGVNTVPDSLVELIDSLPDPWDRATNYGWLATLDPGNSTFADRASELCFAIDEPWRRRLCAMAVTRTLARSGSEQARALFDRATASNSPLADAFFGPAFSSLVAATVFAYRSIPDDEDERLRRVTDLIDRVPAPGVQTLLLTILASHELYSGRRQAAEIHVARIRTILELVADQHARIGIVRFLSALLIELDRSWLEELLDELTPQDRAGTIYTAAVRALTQTPIDVNVTPDKSELRAGFDLIEDVLDLVADGRDDAAVYWACRIVAVSCSGAALFQACAQATGGARQQGRCCRRGHRSVTARHSASRVSHSRHGAGRTFESQHSWLQPSVGGPCS